MKKKAFVTGGGGYVGGKLCQRLSQLGYQVTAFDIRHQIEVAEAEGGGDDIKRVQGDIRDGELVRREVKQSGAGVVFHLASYGMSGREQLNREMIEAVNITGTQNVILACIECSVERLVFTSTFNVVFGGQEIRDGDESLPYFPLDKHVDHYSRTKAVAEQKVLRANGECLGEGGGGEGGEGEGEGEGEGGRGGGGLLKTCALRCAGIYGEGEQRHLPRIVGYIEKGLFRFTYGCKDSLVEFLHADNFVQAHVKAAEALATENTPVAGQAYFISDGCPINNFEFFRPLVEGLGYPYPRLSLPLSLVFFAAFVIELVHGLLGRHVYNFQPLLTRAEVYKTGVTHYFSLNKARAHFGYAPEPRNLEGVVKWFRERGHGRRSCIGATRTRVQHQNGSSGRNRRGGTVVSLFWLVAWACAVVAMVTLLLSLLPTAG